MIRPRPDTDSGLVLALVVAHPGQLDAESIGQRLWRPRLSSTADYLRVRAAILGSGAEWASTSSGLLRRLTEAGYVDRVRPYALAEDWADLTEDDAGQRVFELLTDDGRPPLRALALVLSLVRIGPQSLARWAGTAPSGATKRAVGRLVEAGVVVPPAFRWPTPSGVAWVDGWAL